MRWDFLSCQTFLLLLFPSSTHECSHSWRWKGKLVLTPDYLFLSNLLQLLWEFPVVSLRHLLFGFWMHRLLDLNWASVSLNSPLICITFAWCFFFSCKCSNSCWLHTRRTGKEGQQHENGWLSFLMTGQDDDDTSIHKRVPWNTNYHLLSWFRLRADTQAKEVTNGLKKLSKR